MYWLSHNGSRRLVKPFLFDLALAGCLISELESAGTINVYQNGLVEVLDFSVMGELLDGQTLLALRTHPAQTIDIWLKLLRENVVEYVERRICPSGHRQRGVFRAGPKAVAPGPAINTDRVWAFLSRQAGQCGQLDAADVFLLSVGLTIGLKDHLLIEPTPRISQYLAALTEQLPIHDLLLGLINAEISRAVGEMALMPR